MGTQTWELVKYARGYMVIEQGAGEFRTIADFPARRGSDMPSCLRHAKMLIAASHRIEDGRCLVCAGPLDEGDKQECKWCSATTTRFA